MMWQVRFVPEDRLWTVGYEDAKGKWHASFDYATDEEAKSAIHYLNGGCTKQVFDMSESLGMIRIMLEEFIKKWEAKHVSP